MKRELLTGTADLAASESLAEVTQGVTVQGAAPETKTDSGVALWLLLIATTAMVPSVGFRYALTSTPEGVLPVVPTRMKPGRTKRA